MGSENAETVIIVGAGPSGLATAACLNNLNIPNTVLEREDCTASIWRKYAYDRLNLHLAKPFCQLALRPFPTSYPTYISKDQFLSYVDDYADHFKISPIFKRSVESASYDEAAGKWRVTARNLDTNREEEFVGRFLVVSTGETSDAFVPDVKGLSSFAGEVIHSTRYKNGKPFQNKKVLVVGSGNSGMEIALDLANHGAKTSIAVRSPVHVLTRGMASTALLMMKYLPFQFIDSTLVFLSKLCYGDLTKYGMTRPEEGPFTCKEKYGKYPVIDVGTFRKFDSGEIQALPGLASVSGNTAVFEDGKTYLFDAIIFATGFKRSTNMWLKGDEHLLNEDGLPKQSFPNHWKGRKGLYCAGLARKGLYGAAMDAQSIANDINHSLSTI